MILTVHLSEDELQALERAAAREGLPVEQLARTALLEYASGWSQERDRLVDTILAEDIKVLRRLGST